MICSRGGPLESMRLIFISDLNRPQPEVLKSYGGCEKNPVDEMNRGVYEWALLTNA